MNSFDVEIQQFKYNGSYDYKFDSVGNVILNTNSNNFNQVYLAFPLRTVIYNNNKINSFYSEKFEEFVPSTNVPITSSVNIELQQRLETVEFENEELKARLETLISESDEAQSPSKDLAVKQVILDLRKSLGEGRVDSDFSDEFPYTKINKNILENE